MSMSIKIESRAIPDPQYINARIGECHSFLEEVERFIIEVSQEISTVQQAFNNSQADYENKKEELLSSDRDEIKQLPSIRDREAKVNTLLKNERIAIKNYENQLTGLNSVQRVILLKNRNLNSANKAIHSQLRIMEAQMKLGTPNASDPAVKGLMEEFKKTMGDDDIFKDASSDLTEKVVVDPTSPLDIEDILKTENENMPWVFPDAPLNGTKTDSTALPVQTNNLDSVLEAFNSPEKTIDNLSTPETPEVEETEDEFANLPVEDPVADLMINTEDIEPVKVDPVIDLDQIIDFKKEEKGGEEVVKLIDSKSEEKVEKGNQKEPQKLSVSDFDMDALLDSIQQTH
jgi:hypothetical protein